MFGLKAFRSVCHFVSQGYIGYHIQQALRYALAKRNKNIPVVSLVISFSLPLRAVFMSPRERPLRE